MLFPASTGLPPPTAIRQSRFSSASAPACCSTSSSEHSPAKTAATQSMPSFLSFSAMRWPSAAWPRWDVALGRDHHSRRNFVVSVENFCWKIGFTAHVICLMGDRWCLSASVCGLREEFMSVPDFEHVAAIVLVARPVPFAKSSG
jgi:hypothetical protein